MSRLHSENHLVERIGWLRAAVLGANDGIISTASLVLGVASAAASRNDIMLTGVAGLVAGAMSMAAGEYVSVSSQSDTEHADLRREKRELAEDPVFEREELAQLYVARGVEVGLAREVATQLMAKDALGAHARDELGISEISTARPVQAALASAATLRVTFWGAFAMGLTAGIGAVFGKWFRRCYVGLRRAFRNTASGPAVGNLLPGDPTRRCRGAASIVRFTVAACVPSTSL